MYLVVFVTLALFSFFEIVKKKFSKNTIILIFVLLTFLLVFRYGQGTDYFGNKTNYIGTPGDVDQIFQTFLFSNEEKKEVLFDLCMFLFRSLSLPFEYFIATIAIFMMWLLYRFIQRFSTYRVVSLTLCYAYYWLYFDSAIRQGLAIALLLGFTLGYILDEKGGKALVSILAASLFHTTAIIFLLVLILPREKVMDLGIFSVAVITAFVINILNIPELLIEFMPDSIQYRVIPYISGTTAINIFAFFNRLAIVLLVLLIFKYISANVLSSESYLLNIYLVGFILYTMLMRYELIASRLNIYFKIIEIALLPCFLWHMIDMRLIKSEITVFVLSIVIFLISGINWAKNVESWMIQGNYQGINIVDYEYVSVFNKERIFAIRSGSLYNFSIDNK